jgi:O-antigen ligase
MSSARIAVRPTPWAERIIEGCWLASLLLVPLVVVPQDSMAGAFQAPKMFVLRTITFILIVALAFSFAARPWASASLRRPLIETARVGWQSLKGNPVALAVAAVAGANLISFLFSPIWSVSWGGVDPGFDSYGLFTMISFFALFIALVTHLRSPEQLRRLLWASTATSVIIGVYGLAQHLGFDIVGDASRDLVRLTLTTGNAIFGAAYLMLTIPLSLVLWETLRPRFKPLLHVAVGVGLIAFPLFAIVYSLSRGAMISLTFALIVYLALGAYAYGGRWLRRPSLVLGLSLLAVVLLGLLPTPADSGTADAVGDRIGSIGSSFTPGGGGLSGRYSIWETAFDAYLTTPWIDEEQHPELPGIGLAPLRRIVGFGQDMFGISFRLVEGGFRLSVLERNAHNFLIHTLLELGLLGVIAYLGTAAAIAIVLRTHIRRARQGEISGLIPLAAIGLAATFMGRALEQMAGKAQVSDLLLMWILIGVVAALAPRAALAGAAPDACTAPAPPSRRRSAAPTSTKPWRTGVLAVFALAALVAWWQGPLSDLRALSLSGEAQQAGDAGRADLSGALYEQAIDVAPHASIPRLLLTQGVLNAAQLDPSPETSMQALEAGRVVIEGLLDRNPMDLRAREWAANVTQQMSDIDPTLLPRLVQDASTVVALSPGRWEQLQPLAWALGLSGFSDRALDTVHLAQQLGGADSPDSHLLYYIEAKLEQANGNTERATTALEKLRTFDHPDVAFLISDAESTQ